MSATLFRDVMIFDGSGDALFSGDDVLSRQIADISATGIAWDNEEHSDGICAVGASFIDSIGRDFALSIPVPASRFDAKRDELAEQLRDAIATILRTIPGTNLNTAA
jgi:DNA-binding IclR family transcriptional regulator